MNPCLTYPQRTRSPQNTESTRLERLSPTGKLHPAAVPRIESPDKQALTIVVADEEADAVRGLARILEAQGHRVHQAFGGREAVIIARARRPQLVLVDFSMSDLSGIEASRQIRDVCPDATIILTVSLPASEQQANQEGFIALRKPIDFEVLFSLLASLPVA
jgi:CheY-like chemotaxis protein